MPTDGAEGAVALTPVRLDDVCEIVMGQAPNGSSYNDQGHGWPLVAGAGDFTDGRATPGKFTTAPTKLSKDGDILIGIRASIGMRALAHQQVCLGRGVAALRPGPAIDRRYLWHWIGTAASPLAAKGRGATFLQVNKRDIGEMDVPLPPLAEQRRIADVLDRADALRAKRRAALAQVAILTQSIFLDMFGNPMDRSTPWPTTILSEAVMEGTIVTYGIVQAGAEVSGGVPYIRTGDIVDGEVAVHQLRHTSPAIAARFSRSRVQTGDIVMSIRATVGTTAVVPPELDGSNLTQGTARIAPSEAVQGPYLLNMLQSRDVQRWIQRQVKGATFREITLTRLRELPVRVPPRPLQQAFAWRSAHVDALGMNQRASLDRFDALFASLLHRAFSGAL